VITSDFETLLQREGWTSVFRADRRRPCEERALVLGAMQIDYRVTEQPTGCHLLVPEPMAARAREQLLLYEAENPPRLSLVWPGVPPGRGVPGIAAYAALMLLIFVAQAGYWWDVDWRSAGAMMAGAVRDGELWRVVTALTLHADAGHLAGNLVFGAFFGYFAGQHLGSGVAWLAILCAAAIANLANGWLQLAAHRSLGASTAVFAALGLLGAHVWLIARRYLLGWARRWAPVVGAVALLAYTGTGDERTDIVAHLAGFIAGVAAGLLLGAAKVHGVPRPRLQAMAGLAALAVVVASWWAGLAFTP
jgi:membrane associated rhomboid family serine protease